MSKILILGANGGIGRLFCRKARDAGFVLRAMVRNDEHCSYFDSQGIESVVGDLEGSFAHAFEGCRQVAFVAGSGASTGGDKTLLVDLYGAIRAVEESEVRGVDQFVMVSALRVEKPLEAAPALRHYMVAKLLADQRLLESSVPATVLRPGRLTDNHGSGCVRTLVDPGSGFDISRENVADCIVEAFRQPSAVNRIFDLLDGDVPIQEMIMRGSSQPM